MLCKPRGQSRSKGECGQVLARVVFGATFVLASPFPRAHPSVSFILLLLSFRPLSVHVSPDLVLFPLPQGPFLDEGGSPDQTAWSPQGPPR